jgi:hypothetical protein
MVYQNQGLVKHQVFKKAQTLNWLSIFSSQLRYSKPMQPGFLIPHNHSRRVIATYKSYLEAQKAVDFLSDKGFTVERVAIVAEELRFVEQITGRLDSGKAALLGGLRGGIIGVMIGLVLGVISPTPTLPLVTQGALTGLVIGSVGSFIGYSMMGGKRDFSSMGAMQAGRYDVQVDDEVAEEASRVLATI